jgi:hypothetical protein
MFAALRNLIVTFFSALTSLVNGIGNAARGFEEATGGLPLQGSVIKLEAQMDHQAKLEELYAKYPALRPTV